MPRLDHARCEFQVVWLSDGRIFAIGGWNGHYNMNSVEMLIRKWKFEGETTGRWRPCSNMLTGRSYFAAVVLHDDVVIVAGGLNTDWEWLQSVELFTPSAAGDPSSTSQWTNLQPMQSAPRGACSGVLSDGFIFIFGSFFLPFICCCQFTNESFNKTIWFNAFRQLYLYRNGLHQNPTVPSFQDKCPRELVSNCFWMQ